MLYILTYLVLSFAALVALSGLYQGYKQMIRWISFNMPVKHEDRFQGMKHPARALFIHKRA